MPYNVDRIDKPVIALNGLKGYGQIAYEPGLLPVGKHTERQENQPC